MYHYVILIILIILALYFIYVKSRYYKKQRIRKFLKQSTGVFDQPAREALDELSRIKNPTGTDHFLKGYILQYYVEEGAPRDPALVRQIATNYDAALDLIDNVDQDISQDFILDHIQEFNWRAGRAVPQLDEIRHQITETRAEEAAATANSKKDFTDKYFKQVIHYTDDNQNVHDSKVNGDLKITLGKLLESPNGTAPVESIAEARKFAAGNKAAEKTLDMIEKGHYISTFNCTEDQIFHAVWQRCNDHRNAKNEKLMKTMVVNALVDSVENGGVVCINGRCARILNSLATLDFDPTMGNAMTFEAYKNQIFQESKQIIDNEIQNAKNSDNEAMRQVGLSYDDFNIQTDPAVEEQFKENIKNKIKQNIDNYKEKMNREELRQIEETCMEAV